MGRLFLILICLTICAKLTGQVSNRYGHADTARIFAIQKQCREINSSAKKADSTILMLDSIEVSIQQYDTKIEATSFFRESKSLLRVIFYFDNCELLMADAREQSPVFTDMYAASIFYYINDSIFFTDYYFTIRSCLPIPVGISFRELYGYNPVLNDNFLKNYIRLLYSKIKPETSVGVPINSF